MGSVTCCTLEKYDNNRPRSSSNVVQLTNSIPSILATANLQKQSTYQKIQQAAKAFCRQIQISLSYYPFIARMIAYKHHNFFAALRIVPHEQQQSFLKEFASTHVQLLDSLHTHFIVNSQKSMNPMLTIGTNIFQPAPSIDLAQLKIQNYVLLRQYGLSMLYNNLIGIVMMCAGFSTRCDRKDKFLHQLPIPGNPTILQLLFKNLKNLFLQKDSKKVIQMPILIICNHLNKEKILYHLKTNNYFGFDYRLILLTTSSYLPVIDSNGKYCIDKQFRILKRSNGTAKCLERALSNEYFNFFKQNNVEYLHFIGAENIAQIPGDPLLIALASKLKSKIAAKSIDYSQFHSHVPRYVRKNYSSLHLLKSEELNYCQNREQVCNSEVALNSMVFHLPSLLQISCKSQNDHHMTRRYHVGQAKYNCFDFLENKQMNQTCYHFQKDIRDYITCSPDAIIVKYACKNYLPLNYLEQLDNSEAMKQVCELYKISKSSHLKNGKIRQSSTVQGGV